MIYISYMSLYLYILIYFFDLSEKKERLINKILFT